MKIFYLICFGKDPSVLFRKRNLKVTQSNIRLGLEKYFSKIGKIFLKTIDKEPRWVYNDTVNSEFDKNLFCEV